VRTLQNGVTVEELEKPVTLVVKTKCPSKYKLVDMETGLEYTGQYDPDSTYHWKRRD
jgi:hypothetical protein